MKAQLLRVCIEPERSFSIRKDRTARMNNQLHFHEEIEMIRFHQDGGILFIGDNIYHLRRGDLVLIGANIPHYCRYNAAYPEMEDSENPLATVIHFSGKLLGAEFMQLPESRGIKNILEKAGRGLLIKARLAAETGYFMEKIYTSAGMSRMIALLECLHAFANCSEISYLSSVFNNYNCLAQKDNDRLHSVYNYTLSHFKRKIHLDEIAFVAYMAPNSFCRYFKSVSGKTYSQFLHEIRIGHACKLLMIPSNSIKRVCFESGFHNFSCFHKMFKLMKGTTPQLYKQSCLMNGN